MNRLLSIHISHFNPDADFAALYAGGVRHVSILANWGLFKNPLFDSQVKGARQAGMLVQAHMRMRPDILPSRQFTTFVDMVDDIETVSLGVEDDRGCGPLTISNRAKWLVEALDANGYNVRIYTRAAFVTEKAKPFLNVMKNYDIWYAQYPLKKGLYIITWEQLREMPDYKEREPKFHFGYRGPREWVAWQFTGDRYKLPGCGPAGKQWFADLSWVKVGEDD